MNILISPASPATSVLFRVGDNPVFLHAFNLTSTCQVQLEEVWMTGGSFSSPVNNCGCAEAVLSDIVPEYIKPYAVGCCNTVFLSDTKSSLVIDVPGFYRANLAGTCVSVSVLAQERKDLKGKVFTDLQKGCCPPPPIPGPPGAPGTPGTNGTNGTNGLQGIQGLPGAPGTAGTNGINGTNGLQGIQGLPGAPGTPGTNGANGTNGVNGTNATPCLLGAQIQPGVVVANVGIDANGCLVYTPTGTQTPVDISVAKTFVGPNPVVNPGVNDFNILVSNLGANAATNVVVVDSYSETVQSGAFIDPVFVTYTGGATGPATTTWAQVTSGFTIATMPVGSTVLLELQVAFTNSTVATNTATVSLPPTQIDTVLTNNTSTISLPVNIPAPNQSDLSIGKTFSVSTVNSGQSASLNLAVTNAGPDSSTNVIITDNLSTGIGAQLTFVSPFAVTYVGGSTGPATVTAAQLASGFSVDMPLGSSLNILANFSATPNVALPFTGSNTATVSSTATTDPNPGNNSSTASFTITSAIPNVVDLRLVKTVTTNPALQGSQTFFILNASNLGPASADGATIFDPVGPSGLIYFSPYTVSYFGGASGPATVTAAQLAAGFVIPTFPALSSVEIAIRLQAFSLGSFANTASISAPAGLPDSNLSNNTSTATLLVQNSVPPPPPAQPGFDCQNLCFQTPGGNCCNGDETVSVLAYLPGLTAPPQGGTVRSISAQWSDPQSSVAEGIGGSGVAFQYSDASGNTAVEYVQAVSSPNGGLVTFNPLGNWPTQADLNVLNPSLGSATTVTITYRVCVTDSNDGSQSAYSDTQIAPYTPN